jgi:NADPH:quinone reductase-like Zn-dependent oxidoreductase
MNDQSLMRTFRIKQFGSVAGLLESQEPIPQPSAGQVLIRVRARSLNYRDSLILKQCYAIPAKPNIVPLSDGAGNIEALGTGIQGWLEGDRVCVSYFPKWSSGKLAMSMALDQHGCTRDGMLADYVLADAESLVRIPSPLSYEEGATLPCAGVTSWNALTGGRSLRPGENVLTIGTGGVALFALQFAKAMGARVIALTSSSAKGDFLKTLGADEVIDRTLHPQWANQVKSLTEGRGVDQVVETGSIETLPLSLASCAANAEVALVAALGKGSLDATAFGGLVNIRRVYVGSRADFEQMNLAICLHNIKPHIDRVFLFKLAGQAYEYFEARRHVGKVVIND